LRVADVIPIKDVQVLDWIIMLSAPSLSDYLKIVSDLRKDWKVKDHKELWFRAESSTHVRTRGMATIRDKMGHLVLTLCIKML
jgi:hypothetical protein